MDTYLNVSARDITYSYNERIKMELTLFNSKIPDYTVSISPMIRLLVRKHSHSPNHPIQLKHEDNIVMMMSQSYTSMYMV